MQTILVLTVGGSCQPIVAALRDFAPHYTCFIVSTGKQGSRLAVEGKGNPCRSFNSDDQPSIVTQVGLQPENYVIIELEDPDSLADCYGTALDQLNELRLQYPNCQYVADYTGGTKSMSVGLAMAALDAEWQVSLVKGARNDLVRVVDGTEISGFVNSFEVRARQRIQNIRGLFNGYQFAAAEALIGSVLQSGPLSNDLQELLRQWIGYARGFDSWDRFDHQRAFGILSSYQAQLGKNLLPLKRIVGKDPKRATGYEPVLDLVRNAERRAVHGRYDDAVARLYRTLELFAQTRLLQLDPALSSSALDISLLPESLRSKYASLQAPDSNVVKLGLRQDYDLLYELGDPVGEIGREMLPRLLNALTKRNNSIMAHGSTPLTEKDFREMHQVTSELLEQALTRLQLRVDVPQFPVLGESTLEPR